MNVESFGTARYQVEVESDVQAGMIRLTDTYSGVEFADSDYRYFALVECGGKITCLEGLHNPALDEEVPERGGKIVSINGYLGGTTGEVQMRVRHRFYIPEGEEFLEEQILLHNVGQKDLTLRSYRFGFRKLLAKPKAYGGPGIDIEDYRLIAVPFRLQPDGKKHDYQLDDVYNGRYQYSEFLNPTRLRQEVVDRGRGRSEAWAWADGENGVLVIKYNPAMIEFSMLETETLADKTYLNFGGAAPCLFEEPIEARRLEAGRQVGFGLTRYHFYEGLWRRGSHLFREYMSSLGHGLPEDYNPPIHWNAFLDIGRRHGDREQLLEQYNVEALETEAEKARDMGCEALLLGSGWEVCEGGSVWDEQRLGEAEALLRKIKVEYGLKVGFRAIGRSYCDEYRGMYRRTFDGDTGFYWAHQTKPFYEPCICSRQYQEEKLKRILKVVDVGMDFMMLDEFDWRGPCFDSGHGHPVPTTAAMHARAVVELILGVHEKHPGVAIEAHDPVWPHGVRYLPVYYLHDIRGSFDEAWAFGFARDPLGDLLSGEALSLFYYNLAYDLPLCLHINMENDNDRCLAFWWYASTVRHLGIGGGNGSEARHQAYKRALPEYKSLKDLYAGGEFCALDELTHIHVLPDQGRCVINAFNLTDAAVSREVEVRLSDLGLLEDVSVEGAPHEMIGGKLALKLDIPPFSPLIVKLF